MTVYLNRIDPVPLQSEDFTFEFEQWLSVMVDNLNSVLQTLEDVSFIDEKIESTPYLLALNTTYLIENAALTTVELPDIATFGSVVNIIGKGVGGWLLTPGAGQTIEVAGSSAGTSIASTSRYDCISIKCVTDNTTWVTVSSSTAGFTIT